MSKENELIIEEINMFGKVRETWELLNEIKRLNSNCKTLAKMLDKEIEKNSKAIEYIEQNMGYYSSRLCEKEYEKRYLKDLIKIIEILQEEYNVGEIK
jgi:hypothetical protein